MRQQAGVKARAVDLVLLLAAEDRSDVFQRQVVALLDLVTGLERFGEVVAGVQEDQLCAVFRQASFRQLGQDGVLHRHGHGNLAGYVLGYPFHDLFGASAL